jgi:tungstate transport system permease protein
MVKGGSGRAPFVFEVEGMDFLLDGLVKAIHLLRSGDAETYAAVWATVRVSGLSMAVSLIMGIPTGFILGYLDFAGKKSIRVVVDTLMAPPQVFCNTL